MKTTRREFLERLSATGAGAVLAVIPRSARALEKQKVKLSFYFGESRTADHAREAGPFLRDTRPNVVVIHQPGISKEYISSLEAQLSSKAPLKKRKGNEYYAELHRHIRPFNAKVVILPQGSVDEEIRQLYFDAFSTHHAELAHSNFKAGEADNAIKNFREHLKILEAQRATHKVELEKVLRKMGDEITRRYPELSRTSELRVFLHLPHEFYPALESARKLGSRELSASSLKPIYLPPSVAFQLEPLPKTTGKIDEKVMRTFVGTLLADHAKKIGVTWPNSCAFANTVVQQLSLEQFKRIPALMKETSDFAAAANNTGLTVPESKREIESYLSRKKVKLI